MDKEILLTTEDKEVLRDAVRCCSDEELEEVVELVRKRGLLTNISIKKLVLYRDPAARLYQRQVQTGKKHNLPDTEEYHQKLSESHRGNTARRGIKDSIETLRKKSLAHMGLLHTESEKRKIGLAHKNKIVSQETRQKMSKSSALRTNRVINGYSFMYRLGKDEIYLDSRYELYTIQSYLNKGIILHRTRLRIPYTLDDKEHHYNPDFEYTDDSGLLHILEVKPKVFLSEESVIIKRQATLDYFKDRGIEVSYEFITQDDLAFDELKGFDDPNIICYRRPYAEGRVRNWIYPD